MKNRFSSEIMSIYNKLDPQSQRNMRDILEPHEYPKGSLLLSPEAPGRMYFLYSGKVKIFNVSSKGRECLIRIAQPGEVMCAASLFTDENPHVYAMAITDIMVYTTSRKEFTEFLHKNPEVAVALLKEYTLRLRAAQEMFFRTGGEEVADRLKMYLEDLSEAQESRIVELPLSMKELSDLLATAPETLSRRFARLQEEGWISRKGRIVELLK